MVTNVEIEPPVAIGGVGGSGTRLIAELLIRLGFSLGSDLNESLDNLWFTLLFKRLGILRCPDSEFQTCVDLFLRHMQGCTELDTTDQTFLKQLALTDRLQHDSLWLKERVASFCSPPSDAVRTGRWGWKEPNTHVVSARLMRSIPTLKYIHVVRNGLDMAYSQNQNQLRLWGPRFLGIDPVPIDPRHSLKYWCRVHEHLLAVFECFPGRCLLLNFDRLCEDPRRHLDGMLTFLDVDPSRARIDELALLIHPPASIGRYRDFDTSLLDPQDIGTVAKLGFPTETETATLRAVDDPYNAPTAAPRRHRTAIVVLGMHRSGTSAFTRVAGLLGGTLPGDLMPPVPDNNEAGFWESMGIYRLNDTLLRCAGSRWDDWRELSFDWARLQVSDGFKRRATEAVNRAFGSRDLILVKDPRICRIFPFWQKTFQDMAMDVVCLLPVRNPLEVAASLSRRDGFDPAKSYLLWLRHTLDAEAATRGSRRSIVTFDHLMSDWRDCATRIEQHLGITWPRAAGQEAIQEIDRFLQERLRHNRASAKDLDEDTSVPRWVKQTFSSLLELVDQPDSADAQCALDHVREELRQADRAIGPIFQLEAIAGKRLARTVGTITTSLERQKARVKELECGLARHRSQTNELRSAFLALENHASEREHEFRSETLVLKNRIAELAAKLAGSQRLADDLRADIAERTDRLGQQRDQAAFRLYALQTSETWQLARYLFAAEQRFPATFSRLLAIPKMISWTLMMRLRSRLRLRAEIQQIEASGLFDEAWYVRTYPEMLASGYRAPIHWSLIGWRKGFCPNPLFDTAWYLEHNPDVHEAGIDPLLHYVSRGALEGRNPHQHFSSRWYLERNPDVAQSGINPLTHFLRTGWGEGRNPNPFFDVTGYLWSHPDVAAANLNPLVHYLLHRRSDGRDSQPSGSSASDNHSADRRLDGFAQKMPEHQVNLLDSGRLAGRDGKQ